MISVTSSLFQGTLTLVFCVALGFFLYRCSLAPLDGAEDLPSSMPPNLFLELDVWGERREGMPSSSLWPNIIRSPLLSRTQF